MTNIRIIFILVTFCFTLASPALAENQHVMVYSETGKFCAWPANEGIWSWGSEILVGFNIATAT
jgi:hypothetical protein